MPLWDVYAEVDGSPIYATFETDSDDEDEVFEEIVDAFRSTLQIDLEAS